VFLACLLVMIPAVLGLVVGGTAAIITGVAISVVLLILVSLVSATLHTIILAALYLYAAEGKVPQQFDERLLRGAYSRK
jgi:hypothetical protein